MYEFTQTITCCDMNSQRIQVPKCAFIKYGLDIKGSFIAGSRKCYGKSRGYFWEYENSPDSDCAFQLDQNATHASYDVVMETQIKNSRHIHDQTQVGFHLLYARLVVMYYDVYMSVHTCTCLG